MEKTPTRPASHRSAGHSRRSRPDDEKAGNPRKAASHATPPEESGIPSVATLGRHPIHPMLVPLPIGLFIGALLADLGYWATGNSSWTSPTTWLIGAGLAGGLAAAAAGLTDFFGSARIRALYHSRHHMIGNIAVLAVAALNLWARLWIGPEQAVLPWGLLMSAAIVALLVYTGWHGGEMVFAHGVGMTRHEHGVGVASGGQSGHGGPGSPSGGGGSDHGDRQGGGTSSGGHGGDKMKSGATGPQLAAVGGVSAIALVIGTVAPAGWVNLSLSVRDVGGAIMPPGMIMDYNTPAQTMRDMSAIHPRLVSYEAPADARGDQPLQPRIENGVKTFDLEASVIRWNILGGETVEAYAYNRQIPGPRIMLAQGDRVRINFTNRLPESSTIHWHGLNVPNEMDGPAEITQDPVQPGDSYIYEFEVEQSGTYFYHTHDNSDRQQTLGLYGALLIEPRDPADALPADYDYTIQLQEWLKREWLTYPAMLMEGGLPNFFTINGKSYPDTETIRMRVGETVKLRFIGSNSNFIHPMHVHGSPFQVVARDGETLPEGARFLADTVNVGPGQRYDVIWTARRPGKWLIHCHIPHHMTNNNVEVKGGGGLMMIIDVAA